MVPGLFNGIEDYLQSQALMYKETCLQAMRRMVEQSGPEAKNYLGDELEKWLAHIAPGRQAEGKPLISLLLGYSLASVFRHHEAETQFGEVLSQTSHLTDPPFLYLTGRALLAKALSQTETENNYQTLEKSGEPNPCCCFI